MGSLTASEEEKLRNETMAKTRQQVEAAGTDLCLVTMISRQKVLCKVFTRTGILDSALIIWDRCCMNTTKHVSCIL